MKENYIYICASKKLALRNFEHILKKFHKWRLKHLSQTQFIYILSVLIGFSAGIIAVVIKKMVHFVHNVLTNGFPKDIENYLYFIYPTVGILLAILFIKYIIRGKVEHGIPSVLYAISETKGKIKSHNLFSSIITSVLTVGFGGSVGLEGPTVATGAAVGSNLGQLFHFNYKQIILLLGAASAGAMAAIFKAPITAIVFAMEVIMIDLTSASLVPIILTSVTASLTSMAFLGFDVLYKFKVTEDFNIQQVPYIVVLGIFAGLLSVYFTRMYMFINNRFEATTNIWKRLVIGGLILGVLIFFFPSLFGEGYESINNALKGSFDHLYNNSIFFDYRHNIYVIFALFFVVLIFKVIATATTFGAGGVGGIFAPSLFLGSNLGLFYAFVVKYLHLGNISVSNFAFIGMAGVIAGNLHAPLTAIFLIAEITGGYQLFIPLMIVSVISYLTVKIFQPNSVYTIQLAKRGELMTHHQDKNILKMMDIKPLIETNFTKIKIDYTLGDLVKVIPDAVRNVFPVVDDNDTFLGVVIMDDVRHIMFKPELYNKVMVKDIMFTPSAFADINKDNMQDVAEKFHKSSNYNMPVLQGDKYLGFISKANVFSSYRRKLKYFSED